MSPKKTTIVSLSAAAISLAGLTYFLTRIPTPPSSDEFFARNPHLTRSVIPAQISETPRTSDAFLPGDFALLEGNSYPVKVEHSVKMSSSEKKLLDLGFEGEIVLHSLGVKDRALTVIADFKFKKASSALKLSEDSQTLLGMRAVKSSVCSSCLLLKLDPAGKLKAVFSPAVHLDDASLELKITALNILFKKLPKMEVGTQVSNEADDRGTRFPVTYTVAAAGDKVLKITGKTEFSQKLGGSAAKSAAAGMPAMGFASVEDEKSQTLTWLWNETTSLPQTQSFSSSAEIKTGSTVLSSYVGQASTVWLAPGKSNFVAANTSSFALAVDFKKYLNHPQRTIVKGSKKTGSDFRSLAQMSAELNALAIHPDDTKRDALFLEMARSVKEDPSLIDSLKASAMNAAPGSRDVSMMLGALGFEGSPAAQAAMIDIYSRQGATLDEQVKVMNELALSSQALAPETKQFLKAQYESNNPLNSDTASSAALALGASIAHDGDPSSVKFLDQEWASAKGILGINRDTAKQELILTAMGNSKSQAFLNEVKSVADSSEPLLRSAAVNAVRFAQDTESRKLLFSSLKNDQSEDVKLTAAQSLMYQPFDHDTYQNLQDCTSDHATGVKLECYRALGMNIHQAGVREFLEAKLNGESDAQVKHQIMSALSISVPSTSAQ